MVKSALIDLWIDLSIQRSLLNEKSYGYLHNWTNGKDYQIFDGSITENLDDKGYFGLTFSYRRGKLETTGAPVDLFKISLSGKFGEDQ